MGPGPARPAGLACGNGRAGARPGPIGSPVWQLPVLKMPSVLKIPKVTVSDQEALQQREQ